ncbi:MAG: tRNA (guanosine(18)-2'-O)-methyltransferase TrmH [Ectothiorhodospiraceae bacterium]|nr:tRNA (guanosine(18)-2'-O)-methyltransferase TrmH [Ectothiorhodospiraceae bacterium]
MTANRYRRLQTVLAQRQPDLTVAMAGVHKEHNVSAVIRTCDAVGVWEAHALGQHGRLVIRRTASAGIGRRVPLHYHDTVAEGCANLKRQGFRLYAAHWSERAVDFRVADYTRPCAILLGRELEGMPEEAAEAADEHITVPMLGLAESLNVSVAAAVILYEAQRQRQQAGLYETPRIDEATRTRVLFEWMHPRIARHCQAHKLPYPELDDDGHIRRDSWAQIQAGQT